MTEAETDNDELRMRAGRWLQARRERIGLSQRQMANLIGVKYYTFVSQVESGRARVPAERYAAWAAALGVPAREFVRELMRYYEPIAYRILFEQAETAPSISVTPPETAGGLVQPIGLQDWQKPISELQQIMTSIFIENRTLKSLLRLGGRTV